MNKDNAKDYLPLVQALVEGKTIQVDEGYSEFEEKWKDLFEVRFDADVSQYRIKPEPREIWTNRYRDGSQFGLYGSREEASRASRAQSRDAVQVRYREVIE